MEAAALAPLRLITPRRPVAAAAVVIAGVFGILSEHLWSDTWSMGPPSLAYTPWYAWTLVPFLVLAALAYVGAIAWRSAMVVGVVVEIGALAGLNTASSLTGGNLASYMPVILVAFVLAAWGFDVRVGRAWARRDELPIAAIAAWLLAAALALVAARELTLGDLQIAETFAVIFVSIAVEALPFVLLGAVVSAVIEVFVPSGVFARIAALPLRLQIPGAALAGMAMPVCECGSVPVARRLISRGVHPAAGVAFMLASPVLNPVVLLSTAIAYQGRGALEMVVGRALLGLTLAALAGWLLARVGGVRLLGGPKVVHHHHDGRARAVLDHTTSELWFMGRFIVAGAAVAALLQTAVPQSLLSGVLTTPVVGAVLLMGLAFILSLCSEADAFVAVSFAQFDYGPQLAFLVFGPVLDVKLALLYAATFGRGFVARLALVAVPTVLVTTVAYGALIA